MLKITPYKYQQEGIDYALKHQYVTIGDAMGLGKTLQAIGIMDKVRGGSLVVCPSYLINNWKREIEKFSNLTPVTPTVAKLSSSDVALVSYSSVAKAAHLFKKARVVTGDEFHYIKNINAKRTETIHDLVIENKPEYLIGLTGTAIKNRVTEFYSPLSIMSTCPSHTNGINVNTKFCNYWAFCNRFAIRKEFNMGRRRIVKYEGHQNVDELKGLLKDKYIRRKASEVLDLPEIVRKDILIESRDVDLELLAAWNDGNKAAFATKKKSNAKIKAKHTVRYVKELLEEGQGPIVIYSEHIEPVEMIYKELSKKFKGAYITGGTNMATRDEVVQDFQAEKMDFIAATIGSFSTGITLTAANNMVFNDLSFVPAEVAQAEKRIHRIGQGRRCVIHRILYGTVDYKISKELDKKLKTLVEVL